MAKRSRFFKKVFIAVLVIVMLLTAFSAYFAYRYIYKPNIRTGDKSSVIVYIPTGSTFEDVVNILSKNELLLNVASFTWLAELKKYPTKLKPGRYRLLERMGNNELVNILRAGLQEPVDIHFDGVRTKNGLVQRVCNRLEADSLEMYTKLEDNRYLSKYGMNDHTILSMIIPDKYEFYWNTSVDEFMDRMAVEYKNFWTKERKQKAKDIGLSQSEVAVLASIVQSEQWKYNDEKPIVAGLYLNRLRINMPLQSDPTLIYALGDFSVNRVYNKDKQIESPYNTYKYRGLPPGVICLPHKSSLDAVLNYQKHDYLYMCAKADFSGRHNFARTLEQHNVYASRYRKALNERNIGR